MALDGVFLRHIKTELEEKLLNSKVDKIYQPAKDEIILFMRAKEGNFRLLLSARADSPRIHITKDNPENPQTPPMLCMLLRKRLSGARLRQMRQPALERILMLDFEGTNELGDRIMMTLVIEIMAQYSNVIFTDGEGIIIDALKRVDASMSSRRLILPGLKYELPPQQDKCCMLDMTAENLVEKMIQAPKNQVLSKAVLGTVQGISPVIAREIDFLTGNGQDLPAHELTEENKKRLTFFIQNMTETAQHCCGKPYILLNAEGKPFDFSFMDITQYGSGAKTVLCADFCTLLDSFFSQRDSMERMKSRSADLRRVVGSAIERLQRKVLAQEEELKQCADRERFRICGDLIQANLHAIEKGASACTVQNFYDEQLADITIELNPAWTAARNAQKYYTDYRKAKTAEQVLQVQIQKAQEETAYLSSVLDSLSRAASERELQEIRTELEQQGVVRSKIKDKQRKQSLMPPLTFTTPTGMTVLVGRNNRQNDQLTLKQASKNDLWFHTKDIPGSHTILLTENQEADEASILFAAQLAAAHSKAKEAGKVPVDYTKIRYVSKPQGAKPGMVIYVNQKTLFVTPLNL